MSQFKECYSTEAVSGGGLLGLFPKGSIGRHTVPCILVTNFNANRIPMETVLLALGWLLATAAVGCQIWLAVIAARVAWWWVLVVLFGCGIGWIVFTVIHWDRARRPFLYALGLSVLAGRCWGGATARAVTRGMTELEGNGEPNLPAFGAELETARRQRDADAATVAGAAESPVAQPAEPRSTVRMRANPSRDPLGRRSNAATVPDAGGEPEVTPRVSVAPVTPVPTSVPEVPKVKIEVTSAQLNVDGDSGSIDLELANAADKAVTEVRLRIHYLNDRGVRLGQWTTVRKGDPALAKAAGRGKFSEIAVRMPTAARKVQVEVLEATLEDGTRVVY